MGLRNLVVPSYNYRLEIQIRAFPMLKLSIGSIFYNQTGDKDGFFVPAGHGSQGFESRTD